MTKKITENQVSNYLKKNPYFQFDIEGYGTCFFGIAATIKMVEFNSLMSVQISCNEERKKYQASVNEDIRQSLRLTYREAVNVISPNKQGYARFREILNEEMQDHNVLARCFDKIYNDELFKAYRRLDMEHSELRAKELVKTYFDVDYQPE